MEFGEKLGHCSYTDRPSVYALIFNVDGSLAVTYVKKKNAYFLPGGGVEEGENQVDCIKRECREEIGKDIEVQEYFCQTVRYEQNQRLKANLKVIGDFYFAKIIGDACSQPEEHHELVWMAPEKAMEVLVLDNQAWAVKKALSRIKI